MSFHLVTSHPHPHRVVILGEPVDLVVEAEGQPPSAPLTDAQVDHVRSWPVTLDVPMYEQDSLGRWRDPETGRFVTEGEPEKVMRQIPHPYMLVEREDAPPPPPDDTPADGPPVDDVPDVGATAGADVPFVDGDPGAAPAEEA